MVPPRSSHIEKVPLSDDVRELVVRQGIGAAGRVIQRTRLTSHRITSLQATLVLVERGTKTAYWAGGVSMASAGDALALCPGESLDLTNTPDDGGAYRALWISWSSELTEGIASASSSAMPVTLLPRLSAGFKRAYEAAFDSLRQVDTVPAAIAEHRLREVLLWLRECGVIFPSVEDRRLGSQLRKLISVNPALDWSLEEVARRLHRSPTTLRRRLAEERISFREVLTDVRMSHALALLQNTDEPVLRVANAVGYESPSRFTARFRLRFGYLPSDIRNPSRIRP